MKPSGDIPKLGLMDAIMEVDEERSELDKIFEQMLSPDNISHNTELSRSEITAFSVLSGMAKKYDLDMLKGYLMENLTFRVSKGRGGRKEWVKIVSRGLGQENEFGAQGGRFGNFFQRRRRQE